MQEKAKEPEIRFAGFTGAWEQRKLGDVLEFLKDGTHGTHPDADQGPLLLSAKNIKNGDVTWDDTDRKISQAEFDMIHSNFKLKKGDVLLTIVGSIGESAILKDPHEITFQRSVAFLRPNKTITSGFLYSEIQGEKFQTELNNRKSTSAQPGIYLGDLSEIPLDTPPNLKEQEEIGKFFSEINSLLTLHQRKYEKLLNIKKSMLEKMFPKEGEVVPKIRFKGFTGAWEQRKLSDLCSMHARIGWQNLRTSEFLDQGQYLLITGTDFDNGSIRFNSCHFVKKERYDQDKNIQVKNGSILITKDGTLGKVAYVENLNKPATLNAGVFNVKTKGNDVDNKYLFQYLKAPFLMKYVDEKSTGGTIKHLNQSILVNFPVVLPGVEEQRKIGEFLSHIDSILTLHQRKLEMLKNVKQAFLEKMFV